MGIGSAVNSGTPPLLLLALHARRQRAACIDVARWAALAAVTWFCAYLIINKEAHEAAARARGAAAVACAGGRGSMGTAAAAGAGGALPGAFKSGRQPWELIAVLSAEEVAVLLHSGSGRTRGRLGQEDEPSARISAEEEDDTVLGPVLDMLQAHGVRAVTATLRWVEGEPSPGNFDHSRLKALAAAACPRGLKLSAVLDTTASPAWAPETEPDLESGVPRAAAAWHGAALEALVAAAPAGCARFAATVADPDGFPDAAARADASEAACARAAAAGLRCSVALADALLAGKSAAARLAGSPFVNTLIVSPPMAPLLPLEPASRLLAAAAAPFGKSTVLEAPAAALQPGRAGATAAASLAAAAVNAGTRGLAISGWLERPDAGSLFAAAAAGAARAQRAPLAPAPLAALLPRPLLVGAGLAPPSAAASGAAGGSGAVAILAPLSPRAAAAEARGGRWAALLRCLDTAAPAEAPLRQPLQVFALPLSLLPVLDGFDAIWHLAPAALEPGDARALEAIEARAAAIGVPMRQCGGSLAVPEAAAMSPPVAPPSVAAASEGSEPQETVVAEV